MSKVSDADKKYNEMQVKIYTEKIIEQLHVLQNLTDDKKREEVRERIKWLILERTKYL